MSGHRMSGGLRRWRGLDRWRLRNLSLLVGLYAVVFAVPSFLTTGGEPWLRGRLGDAWWFIPAGALLILATLAPLMYLAMVRRVEARVLADQQRYHRTLIAASNGMIRIKGMERLGQLIVHMVNRSVRLTHTGLFLFDPQERRYVLRAVRHRRMLPETMSLEATDPLIEVLQDRRDLVAVDGLPARAGATADARTRQRVAAHDWMRRLEARLVVPSFSRERLVAFLVLGAKRSGRGYTPDDLTVFSGLANQASLAIENAMVFEELRASEARMIQAEKLASLGHLASGMAHEIHNPLTIISGEAQLFLSRFKGQHPHVDEVFRSIIEECQRAADITRRILRFAKPTPAAGKLTGQGPVDVRALLDEALTLAGYQVRLERVERKVEVPELLPKVRGNQNQLQEVLLNLFINACQAMGATGGTLRVTASTAHDGAEIRLVVEDTGPGIPPETLKQIFEPFYTTKAGGTGLGLFVCQRIVQAHDGSLEVVSSTGEGTRFTIRLPAWREAEAAVNGAGG